MVNKLCFVFLCTCLMVYICFAISSVYNTSIINLTGVSFPTTHTLPHYKKKNEILNFIYRFWYIPTVSHNILDAYAWEKLFEILHTHTKIDTKIFMVLPSAVCCTENEQWSIHRNLHRHNGKYKEQIE